MYLSLKRMWKAPKEIALYFCTIPFFVFAVTSDTDLTIDQMISQSTESLNPMYQINGSFLKRVELDMLCRGSFLKTMTKKQDSSSIYKRSIAVANQLRLWEDARIPYNLNTNFNKYDLQNLHHAMEEYKKYTCIEFHEKDKNQTDYVSIVDEGGCFSEVGRQVGEQQLSLATKCRKIPVILHEFGHVIGLVHEHSRPDRDENISVNVTNIETDFVGDFIMSNWVESKNFGIPYDYRSIMHYGENLGSQGKRVITTKDRRYQKIIGRSEGLSFRDVKLINLLYNCSKRSNCPELSCPGEGFVGQDCLCWCPSANGTTATEHCHNRTGALFYVEDILQENVNTSKDVRKSESQSSEWTSASWLTTSETLIPAAYRHNITLEYFPWQDSGFKDLILLNKTLEFLSVHTCISVFVQTHGDNGSIKVLAPSDISSFIKENGGEQILLLAENCIKITPDGFTMAQTDDCTDLHSTFGSKKGFLQGALYILGDVKLSITSKAIFSLVIGLYILMFLTGSLIGDPKTRLPDIRENNEETMQRDYDARDGTGNVAHSLTAGEDHLPKDLGSALEERRDTQAEGEAFLSPVSRRSQWTLPEITSLQLSEVRESDVETMQSDYKATDRSGKLAFSLPSGDEHFPKEIRSTLKERLDMHAEGETFSSPMSSRSLSTLPEIVPLQVTGEADLELGVTMAVSGVHANDGMDAGTKVYSCRKAADATLKDYVHWIIAAGVMVLGLPFSLIFYPLLAYCLVLIDRLRPSRQSNRLFQAVFYYLVLSRKVFKPLETVFRQRMMRIVKDNYFERNSREAVFAEEIIPAVGCLLGLALCISLKLDLDQQPSVVDLGSWPYRNITGINTNFSYNFIREVNKLYKCADIGRCSELIRCPEEAFIGQDCNCWCPSVDNHSPAELCR